MLQDEESTPRLEIENGDDSEVELIFLGTGTSSSVPNVDCLTAPPSKKPCRTCLSTLTSEGKKNIRRNTSAVLRVTTGNDRKATTLVIDVGKNFQAAAIEWFPKYGLREIDAVLLTHAHADAINGLDDLRGDKRSTNLGWTLRNAIQEHIDIYLSEGTFRDVKRAFPYLVAKEFASGGGDVPDFKWHIIEDRVTFEINDTGVRVTPFSVHHGRLFTASPLPMTTSTPFFTRPTTPINDSPPGQKTGDKVKVEPYFCFGFLLQDQIVYLSDVSEIPDDAWTFIRSSGQKSVLVIDCLRFQGHTSHMGAREAAAAIRRMGARRNYLIGFNHDVSHEEWVKIGEKLEKTDGLREDLSENEGTGIKMMREGLEGELRWVRPAHDGLRVIMYQDGRVEDETYV